MCIRDSYWRPCGPATPVGPRCLPSPNRVRGQHVQEACAGNARAYALACRTGQAVLLAPALRLALLSEQAGCRSLLVLQLFLHSCTPFSPGHVDNVLAQAPGLAQSPPPRSARVAPCAVLAGAASRWRSAVAGGRGSRTSDGPKTPGCAAVSGPACTALIREGHAVARAKGPRHRRLRRRHHGPPGAIAVMSGWA